MDNELHNIGDELVVNVNIQASGSVNLTSFVENITGITAQRYLEKEYRASVNDVLWDDWKELNVTNLSSKTYRLFDNYLHIQIRYVRAGSDATGVITFNDITFNGTWQDNPFKAPTLMSSALAPMVGSQELLLAERNLFKKLYFRGVVPNYIERGENRNYDEDEDYIALTSAIAKFFALLICFNKRFENLFNDEELLLEYVKQWGLYVNDGSIDIVDLQNMIKDYYVQIHNRGTELIFKHKGYQLPNSDTLQVDGEFLRLVRSRICDELLYENIEKYRLGLCIGTSSPLYRGTGDSKQLNKAYRGMNSFPWYSYSIDVSGGSYTLNNDIIKIGFLSNGYFELLCRNFVCDHNLDYEISFEFTKAQNASSMNFETKISGFDENGQPLNDAFCLTDESMISDTFVSNKDLSIFEDAIWYKITFILRSYQSIAVHEVNDDSDFVNLKFNNNTTKYFCPYIKFNADAGTDLFFKNLNIRPLVRGKNILPSKNDGRVDAFSLGFIQSPDIFHTYFRSNNNNIRRNELIEIIEKYLYPFNNVNVFTVISKYE
jgi:hypothetical protein